jgi:hypothetical protein
MPNFLSRIRETPAIFYQEKKKTLAKDKDDAQRASGDKSPKVFRSQFSNPLTPLNVLNTDLASSPNSDLESIVSYENSKVSITGQKINEIK